MEDFGIIRMFFLMLFMGVSLVSARMSLALAREDEDPKWIVDQIDQKCSKPCAGGVRKVYYKCAIYKHSTGETFTTDDSRCKDVTKPPEWKPCNQEKCFFSVSPVKSSTSTVFTWRSTNKWSKCINGCFGGTRCMIVKCWDSSMSKWVPDKHCKDKDQPRKLCVPCRESVSCPPKWQTSEWSVCSKTCGSGIRTREVRCKNQVGAELFIEVDSEKCEKDKRPHSSERCAQIDCPPEFEATPWGPCKHANSNNCGIGSRRRTVQCVRLLAQGIKENAPFRYCARRVGGKMIPPMWTTCRDYSIQLNDNCKRKQKDVKPKIPTDNSTVVQMRRSRRMRLNVGQTAYVFPRTLVIMKCPVKDFDPRDLIWRHDNAEVVFKNKRIQMNYRGRLKIRSVKQMDRGVWSCNAGSVNASLSLNLLYPTEGFREYAIRQPLLSKQPQSLQNTMMSDSTGVRKKDKKGKKKSKKSKGRSRKKIVVQWVSGPWSTCSRTCGSPGTMSRKVQCEKLKNNFYKIYPDDHCKKIGLKKPVSVKQCGSFNVCPMWQVDSNRGKCTNRCLRPGYALQKDRIFCGMNNQRLPLKFCDQSRKPDGEAECLNSQCQLTWKMSNWSKCSRSCGGVGVSSRSIECIWTNTGALAGYNCFKFAITKPLVTRTCDTPKCVLECIDLTAMCKTLKPMLCRFPTYQRHCCGTCKRYSDMNLQRNKRRKRSALYEDNLSSFMP